jgi:hypothetical protein
MPTSSEGLMVAERISDFYPSGWRRKAYRLFEDHQVEGAPEVLELISTLEIAKRIQSMIEPMIGPHEIIRSLARKFNGERALEAPEDDEFMGSDIAYPGGDFYSAILNGIFVNPDPELVNMYGGHLNENGLFDEPSLDWQCLTQFSSLVISEARSGSVLYQLSLAD